MILQLEDLDETEEVASESESDDSISSGYSEGDLLSLVEWSIDDKGIRYQSIEEIWFE